LRASYSIGRELEAVDSEFVLAEQEDSVRRSQLLCHLAKEGHVMHKFGWGNSESLRERPAKVRWAKGAGAT
jgi:secreted Zn-dependent insulinase-like peptidase